MMKNGVFTYNSESYNFDFKTSLSAYEKMIFVRTVVDSIVNDNIYDVVIKDLIFDFAIIDTFTNIDTSFIGMKDDDDNDINPIIIIEHFLRETDIVNIVKANMEIGLLDELNRAVNLNIQYLTGIHSNSLSESLASLVAALEEKINEVDLSNMMETVQKFANMSEDFTLENAMNFFMNSDIHKNNLSEIEDAKKQRAKFAENIDKSIKLVNNKTNK